MYGQEEGSLLVGPPDPCSRRLANVHWGAEAVFELSDTSVPHRTCFLLDEAALKDDIMSRSRHGRQSCSEHQV